MFMIKKLFHLVKMYMLKVILYTNILVWSLFNHVPLPFIKRRTVGQEKVVLCCAAFCLYLLTFPTLFDKK